MRPGPFRGRLTLRALIALVAIAAVGLGAEGLRRRSVAFSQRARFYGGLHENPRGFACGMAIGAMTRPSAGIEDEASERRKAHYGRLERMYHRPPDTPWLAAGGGPRPPDAET